MSFPASVVCFGAGNLGRRVARAVHPILFCDNDPSLWHTEIDGIPVESPKTAVERYPHATFVVAIWNPSRSETMMDRLNLLKSLGALTVVPFTALLAEFGDTLAPHMLWERPAYYASRQQDIARARALFDEEGRQEFDRQLRLRSGDFSGQVIDPGIQYFPEGLFTLSQSEVFVDCGAYNGDTIAVFRGVTGDHFHRIIAFEPDPGNFEALREAVNGDRRITLQPYATGAHRQTLRFAVGGGVASRISPIGDCEVEAIALDEALDGIAPSYMKFDIEGSEAEALEGGRETIAHHRPKMAVCLYHVPDHLWSIPLRLNELLPNSLFSMRTYASDGFECVCYCIPQ
jgi:FkbM family methyltransferase